MLGDALAQNPAQRERERERERERQRERERERESMLQRCIKDTIHPKKEVADRPTGHVQMSPVVCASFSPV